MSFYKKQLIDIWDRKELFSEYFKAMLKLQHVGSALGLLWSLVNPVLYIAIYWIVFTLFVNVGIERYPLFLIPGYLAWNFTLSSLLNSSDSIIDSAYLITKIAFPNEILPFTSVTISLLDYLISLFVYIIILMIIPGAVELSYSFLLIPIILLAQILLTSGLALIISCISVYFRDVPKLVQLAGTILFFLTPVFYPLSFVPEKYQMIILLNPLAQVMTYYQDIFYYGRLPNLLFLLGTLLISVIIFITGLEVFKKYKGSFAELS